VLCALELAGVSAEGRKEALLRARQCGSLADLRAQGRPPAELKLAGYSVEELTGAGLSSWDLVAAGFTSEQSSKITWRAVASMPAAQKENYGVATRLALSGDHELVYTAGAETPKEVGVFSVSQLAKVKSWQAPEEEAGIHSVAVDGDVVAAGGRKGVIYLFSASTSELMASWIGHGEGSVTTKEEEEKREKKAKDDQKKVNVRAPSLLPDDPPPVHTHTQPLRTPDSYCIALASEQGG